MVSLETLQETSNNVVESNSSPRISFSADFLDEKSFISICPKNNPSPHQAENDAAESERSKLARSADFEFLSGNVATNMITADELFYEGKLLPFWQKHYADKLNKVALMKGEINAVNNVEQIGPKSEEALLTSHSSKDEPRMSWFMDDDPSPRPPKCTVLWKELLRLRKQQRPSSTLSPSSSSSSSSSSRSSLGDVSSSSSDENIKDGESSSKDKTMKRIYKKGLERTKSATIRIRPVINVPICTAQPRSSLPPLFSLKKGSRIGR